MTDPPPLRKSSLPSVAAPPRPARRGTCATPQMTPPLSLENNNHSPPTQQKSPPPAVPPRPKTPPAILSSSSLLSSSPSLGSTNTTNTINNKNNIRPFGSLSSVTRKKKPPKNPPSTARSPPTTKRPPKPTKRPTAPLPPPSSLLSPRSYTIDWKKEQEQREGVRGSGGKDGEEEEEMVAEVLSGGMLFRGAEVGDEERCPYPKEGLASYVLKTVGDVGGEEKGANWDEIQNIQRELEESNEEYTKNLITSISTLQIRIRNLAGNKVSNLLFQNLLNIAKFHASLPLNNSSPCRSPPQSPSPSPTLSPTLSPLRFSSSGSIMVPTLPPSILSSLSSLDISEEGGGAGGEAVGGRGGRGGLSDCIFRLLEGEKLYGDFVSTYQVALHTMRTLEEDSFFHHHIQEAAKPSGKIGPLHLWDILQAPVQRMSLYGKALQKISDLLPEDFDPEANRELQKALNMTKKLLQQLESDPLFPPNPRSSLSSQINWLLRVNKTCIDCGSPAVEYISFTLPATLCPLCAQIHKEILPPHISVIGSAKPEALKKASSWIHHPLSSLFFSFFSRCCNTVVNAIWEQLLPVEKKISQTAEKEERVDFIRKKYIEREFFHLSYGHFVRILEKKGKWVERFIKFENSPDPKISVFLPEKEKEKEKEKGKEPLFLYPLHNTRLSLGNQEGEEEEGEGGEEEVEGGEGRKDCFFWISGRPSSSSSSVPPATPSGSSAPRVLYVNPFTGHRALSFMLQIHQFEEKMIKHSYFDLNNWYDKQGWFSAIEEENIQKIQEYFNNPGYWKLTNKDGKSGTHIICSKKNLKLAKIFANFLLLDDSSSFSPLSLLFEHDWDEKVVDFVDFLEFLSENQHSLTFNEAVQGRTPLHQSLKTPALVSFLLSKNVDLDKQNDKSYTPFMLSLSLHLKDPAVKLMEAGADLFIQCSKGDALELVQEMGDEDLYKKVHDKYEERRKIQIENIFQEFAATERSFLESMKILVTIFKPKLKEFKLSSRSISSIFSNADEIYHASSTFLANFESALALPPSEREIGALCLQHLKYFKLYPTYCQNQEISAKSLTLLLEQSSIYADLTVLYQELFDDGIKEQIEGYLIKPVQRICRYPLLLRELLKYCDSKTRDYEKLKQFDVVLGEILNSANEQKRRIDAIVETFEILSSLGVVFSTTSKYLDQGSFRLPPDEKNMSLQCTFFLFSDVLVLVSGTKPNYTPLDVILFSEFPVLEPLDEEIPLEEGDVGFILVRNQVKRNPLIIKKEEEEAIHNKFSKALSNFSSSSFSSPPANSPLQNLFTPLNEGGEGGTRGKGSGLMRVKKREMLQRALFSEEIFEDNEELRKERERVSIDPKLARRMALSTEDNSLFKYNLSQKGQNMQILRGILERICPQGETPPKKAHCFSKHHFRSPRWCDHCKKFIYGLYNQGNKCKVCSYSTHHKCSSKAPKTCVSPLSLSLWRKREVVEIGFVVCSVVEKETKKEKQKCTVLLFADSLEILFEHPKKSDKDDNTDNINNQKNSNDNNDNQKKTKKSFLYPAFSIPLTKLSTESSSSSSSSSSSITFSPTITPSSPSPPPLSLSPSPLSLSPPTSPNLPPPISSPPLSPPPPPLSPPPPVPALPPARPPRRSSMSSSLSPFPSNSPPPLPNPSLSLSSPALPPVSPPTAPLPPPSSTPPPQSNCNCSSSTPSLSSSSSSLTSSFLSSSSCYCFSSSCSTCSSVIVPSLSPFSSLPSCSVNESVVVLSQGDQSISFEFQSPDLAQSFNEKYTTSAQPSKESQRKKKTMSKLSSSGSRQSLVGSKVGSRVGGKGTLKERKRRGAGEMKRKSETVRMKKIK